MELRFRLYVRECRGGLFAAQVLGLPEARSYEATREAAVAAADGELKQQIEWRDRGSWQEHLFYEEQELRPLSLDVPLKGQADSRALPLTVSLLVTTDRRPEGIRCLVTAPRVPGFQLLVTDPAAIDEEARDALARYLGRRRPLEALEAERIGEEWLETLTITLPDPEGGEGESSENPSLDLGGDGDEESDDVLSLCGSNLTAQAERGGLGSADRREALLERMTTALAADRLGSVILVGRPDVGKTALVHELARRLAAGEAPPGLKDRQLWSLTASNLIAGMKYYGEWQGRAQKLVRQAREGRQILYMGDPNEILGSGRYDGSENNLGRYLRPYIESGEIALICECSPEAYAAELRREPSFIQAFRRIDVEETGETDTQAILQAAARRLEAAHPVRIEAAALSTLFDLTRRFLPYRAFPGKAVRSLEEMARDARPPDEQEGPRVLGRGDAVEAFARATGLPPFILSDETALHVDDVRTYFEERLLGQPDAVEAMVDLVTVLKAGLNDPRKPLGSFFFAGPTGVGKTEMAKVLAEYLFGSRERMLRFDMSEYASADALPRLIGSAWRTDDEGELTRRVREYPFCVVLLDEIEKAHREVFDALLSVLGEGRLTDAGGRSADFRNAIIIMTSNLGASRRETQAIGFGTAEAEEESAARLHSHFVKEAEGFFRPEFFNRIDRIVAFRPLTPEAMRRITRRELGRLLMREGIVRRSLLVEIDDAVIDRLVEQGFHPLYGARPLQREIERAVILPLARLLVEGGADRRHLLRFRVRDGRIHLSLLLVDTAEEGEAAAAEPPPDRRLEADLAAVLRTVRSVGSECAAEDRGALVETLRCETAALLARTREPTFWDDPAAAREVLRRIYHLERVLKRLDALAQRAERLEERGQQLRRGRDRRGVPDLAQEVERLSAELSYLQVELAGAAAMDRHDQALLRVTPVGPDAEAFAARLLGMYAAWAGRKGYEMGRLGGATVYIKGSNVWEFLKGEAGLHKLSQGSAEERRRCLARVTVAPAPDVPTEEAGQGLAALLPRLLAEEGTEAADGSGVVRLYSHGRHRFVRDPRTGVRVNHVEAVLDEGQIDAFLLARLRSRAE